MKCFLSSCVLVTAAVFSGTVASSQSIAGAGGAQQHPFVSDTILVQRDFPLFSALLTSPETSRLLRQDAALSQVAEGKWLKAVDAHKSCGGDAKCMGAALELTALEIQSCRQGLQRLYEANSALRTFVDRYMTPIQVYAPDSNKDKELVFLDTWTRSALQLNRIITDYSEGNAPHYKDTDSSAYDVNSQTYAGLIKIILEGLPIDPRENSASEDRRTLFFEPTLRFATRLLQDNTRDEAGRLLPLESGENLLAARQIGSVSLSEYRYSVIVVPGAGSEISGVALSPWGKERLRFAVDAYRHGLAPFILLTGGFVHPSQTPYCEALEMKRYLLEVYRLPASMILVEPFARHTTTNLRNAARQVFEYGLPADRPMLVVSDEVQTDYIQGSIFEARMKAELGYLPVSIGRRIAPTQIEALPSRRSLFVDASDPLDP